MATRRRNIGKAGRGMGVSDGNASGVRPGDHSQGDEAAPVTLVEFGDYECPHSGRAYPIVKRIQGELGPFLRFVFRNFPLTDVHRHARWAADAAEAAAAQGKFWEMHDYLYEHQDALDDRHLLEYASKIGLDAEKFRRSMQGQVYAGRIAEDIALGLREGVRGTPTFFINGVRHDGSYDLETLSGAVKAGLKAKQQVGTPSSIPRGTRERPIVRVHDPMVVLEGGGVPVQRALPTHEVPYQEVDPFLLLDMGEVPPRSLGSEGSEFPKHPHRGFEILTYLLAGAFAHAGSVGDGTVLRAGGVQRITTGRGIWHGEGPDPGSDEPLRALQLWINLARREKGIEPEYQVLEPEDVPIEVNDGSRVRVLVGDSSPLRLRTPTLYLDVTLSPGATFRRSVPEGFQGFVYVVSGRGMFGAKNIEGDKGQLLVLGPGDTFSATARAEPLRFMLAAARPHDEPIRWNGPYVD